MPVTRRSAAAALAGGLAAAPALRAQSPQAIPASRQPRVAYVWLFKDGPSSPYVSAFRERMAQLGWVHGSSYTLELHDADGDSARLDTIMENLVRSKVDVILAVCTPEANSARKFTREIPIVLAATGDPVAAGLVESLARPGTNVTGVSSLSLPLSAKRVELLKQCVPALARATVLWNPVRRDNEPEVKIMQEAAGRLAVRLQSVPVRSNEELASQLEALGWGGPGERPQALLNAGDSLVTAQRQAIVQRAAALRLAGLYEDRVFVEAGGLMSYGPNLRQQHQRAADYVDRLLKGARPGELPIEQPTRFELVLNPRAAKAIGLRFPRHLLAQADDVIG